MPPLRNAGQTFELKIAVLPGPEANLNVRWREGPARRVCLSRQTDDHYVP